MPNNIILHGKRLFHAGIPVKKKGDATGEISDLKFQISNGRQAIGMRLFFGPSEVHLCALRGSKASLNR
jgi:hypothetical protein